MRVRLGEKEAKVASRDGLEFQRQRGAAVHELADIAEPAAVLGNLQHALEGLRASGASQPEDAGGEWLTKFQLEILRRAGSGRG